MDKIISCVVVFVLSLLISVELSVQESCHNTKGKPYPCNLKKCPKVKCKGSLGKDQCNCCDVCLKQEGEICGGDFQHLGKCEHHVPLCEIVGKNKMATCISHKTAIKMGVRKQLKKAKECLNFSKKYIDYRNKHPFNCYLDLQGPSYYCLKKPNHTEDDCCLHTNGCHPNEELYEKANTMNTAYFADIYRDKKASTKELSKKQKLKQKFALAKKAYFAANKNFMDAAKAYLAVF